MMEYKDFHRLATYASEAWRGNFSPAEIAENAYIYYEEYKADGCASDIIQSMLEQLFEDGSHEALEYMAMITDSKQDNADIIADIIDASDSITELGEIIEKCDKLTFYGYGDKALDKINKLRQ